MQDKMLYNTAIVSDDIYVEREADRILNNVILRMAKPAYISVSRQMGKTNLLLRTKRHYEDNDNRYIYIDITNTFNNSRECFRYIIDQILQSNEEIQEFQDAAKIIKEQRLEASSPSDEYQKEIKQILKIYRGNIIIFLDEVDDLYKHDFSDDIFGQIRKTYFISQTHKDLKRITYVLSGVIDPDKLIKTKENSPFNIAISIMLTDFSYKEFLKLLANSKFEFDRDVANYIYNNWLKGNPRMSFEVLSLLEDEYLNGKVISKNLVDNVIEKLYLNDFKTPPIDHIRALVKSDTKLRQSIQKLRNRQITLLTDEEINNFYLYGIISEKKRTDDIWFKNKIIDLSLSLEWINNIELQKKGLFILGKEKINSSYYLEGIMYLKNFIESENQINLKVQEANYYIGLSYFHLGNYEESLKYLLNKINKDDNKKLYFKSLFYISGNYQNLKIYDLAIDYFDEIINSCEDLQLVADTHVNKGEVLIEKISNSKDIIIFYSVFEEFILKNENNLNNFHELMTIIYYKLSLYNNQKENLNKAIEYASINEKISLLLFLDNCSLEEDRLINLNNMYDLIISNELTFDNSKKVIPTFNENLLFSFLLKLMEIHAYDKFNNIVIYSIENIYKSKKTTSEFLFELSKYSISNATPSISINIIEKTLLCKDLNIKLKKDSYLYLGLLNNALGNKDNIFLYLKQYVDIMKEYNNFNEKLRVIDYNGFINLVSSYREKNNIEESYKYATIIENFFTFEDISSDDKASIVLIYLFILDYYSYKGKLDGIREYSDIILSKIFELKGCINELSSIDKQGLESIENQTKQILSRHKSIKPMISIKIDRERGRNEFVNVQYQDGIIKTLKYKKAKHDIKNGLCKIID
jgi:hypothetical protein